MYTKKDKEILITVRSVLHANKTPDRKTIMKSGEHIFGGIKGWSRGLMQLITRGLLKEKNGVFSFTPKGKMLAADFYKTFSRQRYNKAIMRFISSATYGKFCTLTFGKDLCQVSMMDMNQLNRLLSLLKLKKSDEVLDIGCGAGRITEYISDMTGARITGVDFADKVIEKARRRTENKKSCLVFKSGDMDKIKFQVKRFDVIISIDSLYFVENLDRTVRKMKAIVKPDGQMGIFWTQHIKPGESRKSLYPRTTKLARALSKQGLYFRAYNYTKEEYDHWHKRIKTANRLKSEFKQEGNLNIYDSIIKEAKHVSKFIAAGRLRRYLYHVRM